MTAKELSAITEALKHAWQEGRLYEYTFPHATPSNRENARDTDVTELVQRLIDEAA